MTSRPLGRASMSWWTLGTSRGQVKQEKEKRFKVGWSLCRWAIFELARSMLLHYLWTQDRGRFVQVLKCTFTGQHLRSNVMIIMRVHFISTERPRCHAPSQRLSVTRVKLVIGRSGVQGQTMTNSTTTASTG